MPAIFCIWSAYKIDSENLLMLLSTDFVLEVLKNTSYADLKAVDQEREMMIDFSVS